MKSIIQFIQKFRNNYDHLISIQISKKNLLHNYYTIAKYTDNAVFPVLKSNAYSHGLFEIASILAEISPILIVDSYFEALILRRKRIKTPILIIGFTTTENIINSNLNQVCFTITSKDQLSNLSTKVNKKTEIHLKIDTGMNRQGIKYQDFDECITIIKKNKNIVLNGVFSHLADADNKDSELTKKQIILWNTLVEKIKKNKILINYYHLAASSGVLLKNKIKANASRLGLGLYGLSTVDFPFKLLPVMSYKTIISGVKSINTGDTVGYHATFKANHSMRIATIPVGYYEGLDLRLSNKGFVKIRDKFCPIIGRVSMNITCVDVSKLKDVKIGEEVEVISKNANDLNSIKSISALCNTIPYEILVSIPERLVREIV